MFDGNFRSRREVNFSGGTRRNRNGNNSRNRNGRQASSSSSSAATSTSATSRGNTRESTLRNATVQRKQRQEQQRKERACRLIQKSFRGMMARRKLLQALQDQIGTQCQNNDVLAATTNISIQLVLLPAHRRPSERTTAEIDQKRKDLLLLFAMLVANTIPPASAPTAAAMMTATIAASATALSPSAQQSQWFSQKRIVHTALQELQSMASPNTCNAAGQIIDSTALESVRRALFTIPNSFFQRWLADGASDIPSQRSVDVRLFVDVLECAKRHWDQVIIALQTAKKSTLPSSQQRQITAMSKQLFQWCNSIRCRLQRGPGAHATTGMDISPSSVSSHTNLSAMLSACIAIVFLTTTSEAASSPKSKTVWIKPLLLKTLLPQCLQSENYYEAFVEALVPVLTQVAADASGQPASSLTPSTLAATSTPTATTPGSAESPPVSNDQRVLLTFVSNQMRGNESNMLNYALHLLQLQGDAVSKVSANVSANPNSSAAGDNQSNIMPDAGMLKPHALIYLLNHTFQKDPQLAFLTSLVVRGQDIRKILNIPSLNGSSSSMSSKTGGDAMDTMADHDFSDSDDEDDDEDHMKDSTATQAKKTRRSSSRYSRKDLSTLPKLDRMYQNEIIQLRNAIKAAAASSAINQQLQNTVDMACAIGQNSKQWLNWGLLLLSPSSPSSVAQSMGTIANTNANMDANTAIQDAYLDLMAKLLQTCTGIRTNSKMAVSSAFMTQIGFSRPYLHLLWQNVALRLQHVEHHATTANRERRDDATDKAFSVFNVFCDLFTHHLIGISDDEFLKLYTDVKEQNDASTTIMAKDVVVRLRDALHQLYWTKPVLVTDAKLACPNNTRFRLLLAGTKLWNALYERWNRLVRNSSFCEESMWYFPYLSSRDGHGALMALGMPPAPGSGNNGDDDDDDGMDGIVGGGRGGGRNQSIGNHYDDGFDDADDDDDDDDSDAMEVDEDGAQIEAATEQAMDIADSQADALAGSFRDPKMARILTFIPQAIPFDRRVRLFHSLLTADKIRTQDDSAEVREVMMAMMRGEENDALDELRHQVAIHRSDLYKDSMDQLNELGPKLKRKIKVSFYNQHDQLEAGIDGGGVFKEFLDDLINEAFLGHTGSKDHGESAATSDHGQATTMDTNSKDRGSRSGASTRLSPLRRLFSRGNRRSSRSAPAAAAVTAEQPKSKAPKLFEVTPLQTLSVKSNTTGNLLVLQHYEFLGRVLGKAVYESILVEPQFCLPFLNQLLGKTNSVEDLKNFDPEYYENLTSLRKLSAADIESAGLTFELTIGDSGDNNMPSSGQAAGGSSGSTDPYASLTSKMQTIELVPGGRDKAVTKQNVIQYIHLVAHYRLNIQAYHQTRAFLRGFRDLIPASWVRLFSANELQKLIGGDDSIRGIDVAALKRSMQYAGGYHPSQPVVHDFWDLLQNDFTPDQQKKFLKFMTSCSRQPLLGFGSLEPAPCIQQIRLPEGADKEQSRLPTSATCFNLLKLPNYGSKNLLRKKLLAAIESGAGFELT